MQSTVGRWWGSSEVVDVGGDGALPGFPEFTRILECPLSTDGRSRGGDRPRGRDPREQSNRVGVGEAIWATRAGASGTH